MSYGLELDGFSFNYGVYSVIASGTVIVGYQTFIAKLSHPDITDWRIVFIPTGVRSPGDEEVRPSFSSNSYALFTTTPSNMSPHKYIVLGR